LAAEITSKYYTANHASYFFLFVFSLTLNILILLALCVGNMVLRLNDLNANYLAIGVSKSTNQMFGELMQSYPMSLIIGAFTFVVSCSLLIS
jgi:hypothetical protein